MDIHVDPPRHDTSGNGYLGKICYRAIVSGDCPLSHDYANEPITADEEAQLEWIKAQLAPKTATVHAGDWDISIPDDGPDSGVWVTLDLLNPSSDAGDLLAELVLSDVEATGLAESLLKAAREARDLCSARDTKEN